MRLEISICLIILGPSKMTTAARPTFEPARGGRGKGEGDLSALSKQYSSRDLPGHTKIKYRWDDQMWMELSFISVSLSALLAGKLPRNMCFSKYSRNCLINYTNQVPDPDRFHCFLNVNYSKYDHLNQIIQVRFLPTSNEKIRFHYNAFPIK